MSDFSRHVGWLVGKIWESEFLKKGENANASRRWRFPWIVVNNRQTIRLNKDILAGAHAPAFAVKLWFHAGLRLILRPVFSLISASEV